VHPQKRILLKEMLENTMIRLVECKHELIKYNTHSDQVRSDFINLDLLLQDLKLDFSAIEIPVPRYFKDDKNQAREERNQLIDKFLL
jgi:IQ and AAA domain-containing protein